MTRAFGSLLRGEFAEAMRFHPLAIFVALQAALLLVVLGARHAGAFEHRVVDRQSIDYWILRIGVFNFVAFVAVWAARWKLGLLDAVV